jgi:hypothetical protein
VAVKVTPSDSRLQVLVSARDDSLEVIITPHGSQVEVEILPAAQARHVDGELFRAGPGPAGEAGLGQGGAAAAGSSHLSMEPMEVRYYRSLLEAADTALASQLDPPQDSEALDFRGPALGEACPDASFIEPLPDRDPLGGSIGSEPPPQFAAPEARPPKAPITRQAVETGEPGVEASGAPVIPEPHEPAFGGADYSAPKASDFGDSMILEPAEGPPEAAGQGAAGTRAASPPAGSPGASVRAVDYPRAPAFAPLGLPDGSGPEWAGPSVRERPLVTAIPAPFSELGADLFDGPPCGASKRLDPVSMTKALLAQLPDLEDAPKPKPGDDSKSSTSRLGAAPSPGDSFICEPVPDNAFEAFQESEASLGGEGPKSPEADALVGKFFEGSDYAFLSEERKALALESPSLDDPAQGALEDGGGGEGEPSGDSLGAPRLEGFRAEDGPPPVKNSPEAAGAAAFGGPAEAISGAGEALGDEIEAAAGADAETGTEAGADAETGIEADVAVDAETGAKAPAEFGAGDGSQAQAQAEADSEAQTEALAKALLDSSAKISGASRQGDFEAERNLAPGAPFAPSRSAGPGPGGLLSGEPLSGGPGALGDGEEGLAASASSEPPHGKGAAGSRGQAPEPP